MRTAVFFCLAGCTLQTSTSSSFGPRSSQTQTQTQSDPAATGQNAPDNRDPGGPSRQPPAGLSTEIALSPPPGKNQDGTVAGPGGPIGTAPATCGPARGHCLRGSFFANAGDTGGYSPVFIFDGEFYLWTGQKARQDYAYKSVPATAANLATARQAVVFRPSDENVLYTLPQTEQEALIEGNWANVSIRRDTIDASAGTFEDDSGHKWKFEYSRALLDWIHAK